MFVEQAGSGPMGNFGYLVGDEESRQSLVIDPSFDARPLQRIAREKGFAIAYVLLTHGHPDHCADAERLARETGARVAAHRLCRARKDVPLEDGRTLAVGKLEVQVLHTPGHTPDGCCFLAGKALFTGDTLFVGECGRVDLADSDVEAMYDSLMRRLFELPDDLVVYPGHDYGRTSTSTIGREKRENYVLRPRTLPQFIAFMREP